ncbi:spheroidene monooxygenase [Phytoactinopolyspora mesophila]|uniref:spheroidene monooxygenase n=1 Tax=Phytoactinopolyspora mesophila TaxID=2650750 RepID=UPI001391C21D|nr:spheroidene monooxygenase [Phytoactinopolyspora mesophila]
MITTVHVVAANPLRSVGTAVRRVRRPQVPGMRWGTTALAVPLAAGLVMPLRRNALIAFWDDEAAADAFFADHPLGQRFTGGFEARLRPLRAYGSWAGFPVDVSKRRRVEHDGPVAVITMSALRISQLGRFMRTSKPAEKAALDDPGMLWGTAAVRLPFAATISLWRDSDAVRRYAYSRAHLEHPHAIKEQRRRSFSHESLFARYAPISLRGSLTGGNPLEAARLPDIEPAR